MVSKAIFSTSGERDLFSRCRVTHLGLSCEVDAQKGRLLCNYATEVIWNSIVGKMSAVLYLVEKYVSRGETFENIIDYALFELVKNVNSP